MIPTYAANGQRIRDYTETAIARLLSLDLVVVERGRRNKIRCAHLRPQGGANPLRRTAHTGTYYSFEEPLPSGHFVWKHRPLLQRQDVAQLLGEPIESEAELDRFLQSIFRAVPLSVMKKPSVSVMKKPSVKVVSISRRKRPARRPVEFDSQDRLAA